MPGTLAGRLRSALARRGAAPAEPVLRLDEVRRRLELLLAALYGRPIPIAAAEPPARPGLLRRLLRRPPRERRETLASSDGERILLPPALPAPGGDPAAALSRYRLLALEQAERLARGTAALLPGDDAPLERDLYLILEGAAAERSLARAAPGLLPALAAERAAALAARPAAAELTGPERRVEELLRRLLAADPAEPHPELAPDGPPAASLARARELAARWRDAHAGYHGVPPVEAWGALRAGRVGAAGPPPTPANRLDEYRMHPQMELAGTGRNREAHPWERGKPQDAGEAREEGPGPPPPAGGAREGEGGDPPDGADPGGEPAGGEGEGAATAAGGGRPGALPGSPGEGVTYPEWDFAAEAYRRPGATVRPHPPALGEAEWAAGVLGGSAALVRQLRQQFERLRARRVRLLQQRDGDELDVAACVRALVDLRTGHTPDDRLYLAVRPARREIAIALLVDISGSTDTRVGPARIIDIEKVALLLTGQALDALGDRYAVLTFSGEGAGNVRVRTLKDFAERNGTAVQQRIAALRPEGYTRLGAAVRHASALLARQGTAHRLLLILSDGKPHDADHYQGRYAVEDSRQAIAEARAQGVYPFCLTVDQKAASYLTRIFGEPGHMILRHADQLPQALLKVVRHLLAS